MMFLTLGSGVVLVVASPCVSRTSYGPFIQKICDDKKVTKGRVKGESP